jgi:uncharacterized protein involved in exopolysaccharide biosynthesis
MSDLLNGQIPQDIQVGRLLWSKRWQLLVCVVLSVLVAVAVSAMTPPRYSSRVSILPRQGTGSLGILQGIAGISIPGTSNGEVLETLYGKIIKSDLILDKIIETKWSNQIGVKGEDLFTLLRAKRSGVPAPTDREIMEMKKRLRRGVIAFERDTQTGFIEIRVEVPRYPWLAAAMADSIAAHLNVFMQQYRAGKAVEQSEFVSSRVHETEIELSRAEARLAEFVTTNRMYSQSMALTHEYQRLRRDVDALLSVWVELRRQLELSRIESNDRKRSVDILDTARIPVERSWPRYSLSIAIGVVLGVVLWAFGMLGGVVVRRMRFVLDEDVST